METKWIVRPKIDKKIIDTFPEYSPLMLQLLYNRGLTTEEALDEFFNPDYKDHVHDPLLLKGMEKAIERIKKALENNEKILVYGDYDADGVTSTAIIIKTLKFLGAKSTEVYIPDRAKEGYGLKKEAIPKIKELGVKLIITVDCGIANREEIALANKLGLDVIVTDHHWVPENLPEAAAIINPKQPGDAYPFKDLAGVGVAFKLAQGLLRSKTNKLFDPEISPEQKIGFEKWLLDLVAIGTVADSVPLLGENRTFLTYGLIVLGKTKNPGLQELIKKISARAQEKQQQKGDYSSNIKITSETIGFQLAPRINAAGRLDHANTSFALLSTESKKEAQGMVESLELLNSQRQNITDKIIKEIRKKIGAKPLKKIIFEGHKDWPQGILGLVAGKLSDEFYRPVFIYNRGEQISAGSCRSIPSFNVIETLSRTKDLLLEFGGHKGAAGFKISNENIGKFEKTLQKIAEKEIRDSELAPSIEIDAALKIQDINWNFMQEIEKISPYGEGNPEPVFLLEKMKIKEIKTVGNGEKHLKLTLEKTSSETNKNFSFKAIGFNFGQWIDKLKLGSFIDIAFTLSNNEWNGNNNLEFKIMDLKAAEK